VEGHHWSFLSDVISFLLSEAATRTTPWRPLILYGVMNEKELQGVGQGEYAEFKRQLAEEGVPKAICDLLFAKNVAVAIGAACRFLFTLNVLHGLHASLFDANALHASLFDANA
jgi:hypothetical protein